MSAEPFVIFVEGMSWRIGNVAEAGPRFCDIEIDEGSNLSHTAQRTAEAMAQQGYEGQAVAMALAANECLCASIETPTLPRKHNLQEMSYRLEGQLPIATEEYVAQFIECGDHALGVCVQIARISPIVDALEQHAIRIELICPTALLGLQSIPSNSGLESHDVLLWGTADHVELFTLIGGKPVAWRHLATDVDGLAVELAYHRLNRNGPLRVYARNIDQPKLAHIASLPGIDLVGSDDEALEDAATTAGCQILLGQQAAWLNLRLDALAVADPIRQIRKSLSAVIAAALLFLVSASGVMLWRAGQYERQITQARTHQDSIYSSLYPGKPVPISVISRLVSERRRLRLLSGDDATLLSNNASILAVMHEVLEALPTNQHYRILELRIEDQELHLAGQAQFHSVADEIAASLTQHSQFVLEPPRTQQLRDKGISFILRGVMQEDKPDALLTSR